jgi:hypothetical protein
MNLLTATLTPKMGKRGKSGDSMRGRRRGRINEQEVTIHPFVASPELGGALGRGQRQCPGGGGHNSTEEE